MALTFGETIREWRTQAGLSQTHVAEAVPIDHTYLSKIETGAMPAPSSPVLYALCQVLGKPQTEHSDELFRLCGRVPEDVVPILTGSRYALDLIRACEGLDEQQMQRLIRCAVAIDLPEGV